MGNVFTLKEQNAVPVPLAEVRQNLALEGLYTGNRRSLVDSAQAVLGCRARAEDVVQDAFLKLWESGGEHAIQEPLRYLFRMVRNLSIDRLRRMALEGRYRADDDLLDELPALQSTPEQRAIGQLEWQRMQLAIAELPERTRTVFTMSQLEGFSQREVATHLNASPTLVHFLLRDALVHCRSRLGCEAA
ncbi:sigma-70 family RNA polymerase sigma factor [Aquipseudomonas ullengensis]|uniref:Sigma-70 family RNA polymerase sigma factor n=1 Tax=Aquipseudomonas ullengensis TaxID=2759166 RepID=A0A7W4LMP7_9GAMM|nr:sigma-70 family RNA polymerase sigma factor [Pseudomonas ullengensis]MBB2496016.1 sigma-70 family RNA polymerase sigma factor [Pseudomonas ullengensis]